MASQFKKHNMHTAVIAKHPHHKTEIFQTLSAVFNFSKIKVVKDSLSTAIQPYSSLIAPIILSTVAVYTFIITNRLSNDLKTQIEQESLVLKHQVESLLPVVVPQEQWEIEKAYQDRQAKDAERIAQLAKQTTQRELLSYNVFPRPADSSIFIFNEFGQKYCAGVRHTLNRLNSGKCPSDSEIHRSLREIGSSTRKSRSFYRNSLNAIQEALVDNICMDKARSISVYIDPTDISGYKFWKAYENTGHDKGTEDCWYWQIGYWVVEDVLNTIGEMNAEYDNVLTAPVKRLLNVSFTKDSDPRRKSKGEGRPRYVVSSKDGLTKSLTGRKCNEDMDVIHFKLDTLVSAEAVMPFMKELCSGKKHKFKGFSGNKEEQTFVHNQITILEINMEAIDPEHGKHKFHRYGQDAVMNLSLVCEYIFNKAGYDQIKPDSVSKSTC